jgi:tetratricopeptide (TPR) repeat protein
MDTTLLNPFVVGGAITDPSGQGFFGREKVFDFVRSALNSVQRPPILLIGQRRIGKSSVLRQLPSHLAAEYCCVYFDLQGKEQMTLDALLYGLARSIADGLKIERPNREQATEAEFNHFLEMAFEKLGGARSRLVLLFDEFDVLDQQAGAGNAIALNRFIPFLSELCAQNPGVGLILVVGRKTEELSGSWNRIILKDSVQYSIGRLELPEIRELVKKGSAEVLSFNDAAILRLFAIASGHPFCTQVLCHVIWSHALKRTNGPPFSIAADDVDRGVPEALDLGANGMNWIFDGLTEPTHRLVLAAIGQQTEPLLGTAADRAGIDAALRNRGVFIESVEVDRAIQELESWDVIVPSGSGFVFGVPIIGQWIKTRRPLDRLQNETRFANPRAWKFYELGLDSRKRGDIDQAVKEFRSALEANPAFADAQRAIASALYSRKRPEETAEIIENLERALEFDPTGPRTELLESLTDGLTTTKKIEIIRARFKRIRDLDSGGRYENKAIRLVNDLARKLAELPSNAADAAVLFELTGEQEEADSARRLAKRNDWSGWGALVWVASLAGLFAAGKLAGKLPIQVLVPWLRLGMAIVGSAGLLSSSHFSRPKGIPPTSLIWCTLIAIAGAAATYFTHSSIPAYLVYVAYFLAFSYLMPDAKVPGPFPEDSASLRANSVFTRISAAMSVLTSGSPNKRSAQKRS